jgi:hypothetical protein
MVAATTKELRMTPLRLIFCVLAFSYIALMVANIRASSEPMQQDTMQNRDDWKLESKGRTQKEPPDAIHSTSNHHHEKHLDGTPVKKNDGEDRKVEPISKLDAVAATLVLKQRIQDKQRNDKDAAAKAAAAVPHPVSSSSIKTVTYNVTQRRPNHTSRKEHPPPLRVTKEEAQHMEDPIPLHMELKSFYANFTTSNNNNNNNNLWDKTMFLPDWMKTYLNWHKYHRQRIADHPELYSDYRYFVMQCIRSEDYHCGGTSDRLKPIPWAMRVAYYNRRLLFIHWTRPASLEEFLVPPKGGLDWRLPKWLADKVRIILGYTVPHCS